MNTLEQLLQMTKDPVAKDAIIKAHSLGHTQGFADHNDMVWHNTDELPINDDTLLLDTPDDYVTGWYSVEGDEEFRAYEGGNIVEVKRWAYIDDLIPKE